MTANSENWKDYPYLVEWVDLAESEEFEKEIIDVRNSQDPLF